MSYRSEVSQAGLSDVNEQQNDDGASRPLRFTTGSAKYGIIFTPHILLPPLLLFQSGSRFVFEVGTQTT